MVRVALFAVVVGFTLEISLAMAQQTTIRRGVTSFPGYDVPFEISGEIYFLSDRGCWALVAPLGDFPAMHLEGLPKEFQVDGFSVVATVHLEEGKTSECLPPFKAFVDEISPAAQRER